MVSEWHKGPQYKTPAVRTKSRERVYPDLAEAAAKVANSIVQKNQHVEAAALADYGIGRRTMYLKELRAHPMIQSAIAERLGYRHEFGKNYESSPAWKQKMQRLASAPFVSVSI